MVFYDTQTGLRALFFELINMTDDVEKKERKERLASQRKAEATYNQKRKEEKHRLPSIYLDKDELEIFKRVSSKYPTVKATVIEGFKELDKKHSDENKGPDDPNKKHK